MGGMPVRFVQLLPLYFVCAALSAEPAAKAIPFDQLGVEAGKQYSGEGIGVTPTATGARLRASFQDLEAEATPEGLWLQSTGDEDGNREVRFRLRAVEVSGRRIEEKGEVRVTPEAAAWLRPGLIEEYRVSMEGVRQDFVVLRIPDRPLAVALELTGARAEAARYGAKLILDGNARELAYNRLHVTDATGRELSARMEVTGATKIEIQVDDAGAVYPVRIDPTFSDTDWVAMATSSGLDDTVVFALTLDSAGNLYIGGRFTTVGGISALHIAKWNGSTWSALGSGIGKDVIAMAASGTSLYVGGVFFGAGGSNADYIAKWDGTAWSPLGTGVDGAVRSLAVAGSDLYVGGDFTTAGGGAANRIAKWNGTAWSPIGSGMNESVRALAVSGTDLLAGGFFTTAGGTEANGIAKWNGSSWSALGLAPNSRVRALAVAGTDLYVGGSFFTSPSVSTSIARWNGSTWTPLGSEILGTVLAIAISGSNLYAGGDLYLSGIGSGGIARWNGTAWSAMGMSSADIVYTLGVWGNELFAGGRMLNGGLNDAGSRHLARWTGTSWVGVGPGLNGAVRTIASSGTDLFIGGDFTLVAGKSANRIAKWNGTSWSAMGTGMDAEVNALAISGTDLIAGGNFTSAGGTTAKKIAKWNGTSWSSLGSGMEGSTQVNSLAVAGTSVYAGGNFSVAGGVNAPAIARWNGSAWSSLGSGIDAPGIVHAVAVVGTDVYAGGAFASAGGIDISYGIAKWNGSSWGSLGFPFTDGPVRALAVVGTDLYAGGEFSEMGFQITPGIAKWDGTTWSPIGSGTDAPLLALAASGSKLFVGGSFLNAGRKFSPRLARLDLVASGPAPEIAVSGNGNYFIDGDSSPLLIDHRDFGSAPITGATITRTFAISNQGTGNLTIGAVTIGGIAARDFSVSLAPVTPVAAGGITIVQVTFDPSVAGTRSATVSFSNNDSDEDPFNFSIQGTGTFPEINVSGNSTNIVDGDATPSPSDHTEFGTTGVTGGTLARTFTISNSGTAPEIAVTGNDTDIVTGDSMPSPTDQTDFGSILVSGQAITRTFTISNLGTANLTLGAVSFGGTNPEDFAVTEAPASSVPAGSNTTLKVRFAPILPGNRSATLSFATNDPGENPFTFAIAGSEPLTDSDTNGFTDAEEAAIAALRTRYAVGETVDLDLGFLRLPASQTLVITGLPPGVRYNPQNRRIEGTITGELGGDSGEIRKLNGPAILASMPFNLAVAPYPFLGSFEGLLENGALPAGKAKLTITGPGVFSATLERQGEPARSTRGTFAPSGGATQSVAVTFPLGRSFPETTVSFVIPSTSDLVTGSNESSTLRGFRLVKPDRSWPQRLTVAFDNAVPGNRTTTPGGTGSATGSLNSTGLLPLTSVLGDGQAVTMALSLS